MLAAFALAGVPDGVAAEFDSGLEVTADRLEYVVEKRLYIATGGVRLVQPGQSLDADWVAFSSQTNLGVASGHVRVRRGSDVLLADFFEFEVDTLKGVVFGASLDAGTDDFIVEARELAKTGEDSYEFVEGSFSTCRCPEGERLPWKLSASEGEFELGGYATTRNTTVDVLGVPALWLPWMIFPIKTDRQSGLLFPEFAFGGRNGVEIGVPIFWAARDPLNITLTPRYITKRGFKPDVGVSYVLGQRSWGHLYGSFVRDTQISAEPADERAFDAKRWAVIWEHAQYLPADWRFKADVKLASDNRHASDFHDLERYRNYRFLESNLFAFNHFGGDGRFGVTGAARWADDKQDISEMLDPDPDQPGSFLEKPDPDDFLLQRLPDIQADILPGGVPLVPGLVASMETDYTYFSSRKRPARFAAELAEGAATPLDELEIDQDSRRARGNRLSFHPRLAYPLRLFNRFELHPELGYYETLYSTAGNGFSHRGLVTGRVDLRTRFSGDFDLPSGSLRHLIEARGSWTYVQDRDQSGNPIFVPSTKSLTQSFLRELQPENIVRDGADFIPRANLLTFGVGNRIYRRHKGAEQLLADIVFSAGYDFARVGWARLNIDGSTFPRSGLRTRFMLSFDPEKRSIEEGLMEAGVALPQLGILRKGSLTLAYRFRKELPTFLASSRKGEIDRVNQIGLRAAVHLGPRWMLNYAFSYSLAGKLLLGNRAGVAYTSACHCWRVTLEARQDRVRDVEFRFGVTLLGLGDQADRPRPLFDSKNPR